MDLKATRQASETTVVLVDDHVCTSAAMATRLDSAGFRVIATLDHAGIAVAVCQLRHPALVLMDIDMPGADPFVAVAEILAVSPSTRVLFFSGHPTDKFIDRALASGAAGFVTKTEKFEHLVWAMQHVLAGHTYFSPRVAERFAQTRGQPPTSRLSVLTPRELEVLRYLAQGMSCGEVGKALGLSRKTVEKHQYRVRGKLKIDGAVELARFAIREGLLAP